MTNEATGAAQAGEEELLEQGQDSEVVEGAVEGDVVEGAVEATEENPFAVFETATAKVEARPADAHEGTIQALTIQTNDEGTSGLKLCSRQTTRGMKISSEFSRRRASSRTRTHFSLNR